MLTNSIKTFCPDLTFPRDAFTQCENFTILPIGKCYEIAYGEWEKFFEDKFADEVMNRLKSSKSYFSHLFNSMQFFKNKTYQIRHDSESALIRLAKQFCPKVYKTMVRDF